MCSLPPWLSIVALAEARACLRQNREKPAPAQTVLIIDDEEPIRDAVHFILEEAGFAVLEASDGGAGLALLRASEVPLVVLLDLMMPGMSGLELLRAVAAEPALADRDAYIIFSAARAFSAPPCASTCRASGCSTCRSPSSLTTWWRWWNGPHASSTGNARATTARRLSACRLKRWVPKTLQAGRVMARPRQEWAA
jgi:CheY-like chemotaxis protein